jgi:hypothetical protein
MPMLLMVTPSTPFVLWQSKPSQFLTRLSVEANHGQVTHPAHWRSLQLVLLRMLLVLHHPLKLAPRICRCSVDVSMQTLLCLAFVAILVITLLEFSRPLFIAGMATVIVLSVCLACSTPE